MRQPVATNVMAELEEIDRIQAIRHDVHSVGRWMVAALSNCSRIGVESQSNLNRIVITALVTQRC